MISVLYAHLRGLANTKEQELFSLRSLCRDNDEKQADDPVIDRNDLEIMQQLGKGQFGLVCLGRLTRGRHNLEVAVKMAHIGELPWWYYDVECA